MPSISVNGLNVNFTETGSGDPVVLVHGGAATSRYWDGVSNYLVDRHRLIALDLYGCGETGSWPGVGAPSHDDEAELICAILNQLESPTHLVGHSYGGSSALRAAIRLERNVQSLVLLEPPIYLLLEQAGEEELYRDICGFRQTFEERAANGEREAAMELMVDRFSGAGTWANLPAKVHTGLLDLIEPLIGGFAANHDNPTTLAELSQLQIPTLLICGDNTGVPEKAMVNVLAKHLPQNQVKIIEGAPHQSPMTHPKEVAESIMRHLSDIKSGRYGSV